MDQGVFCETPEKRTQQKERIARFLEERRGGDVVTVLWHNNHLTPYRFREMKTLYTEVLKMAQEQGMEYRTPSDLTGDHFENGK